ncbi:hypothetical protein MMC21_008431 [Puttea exsequens]|nr:hypothetical protein [Puttea exsequens]
MVTHAAVVTVAPGAPLEIQQLPTPNPKEGEVLLRSQWTASTPLDLHQNDGHLLVTPPQVLGDGVAGTVIQVGLGVTRLKEGDKVFGFVYQNNEQKAHQKLVCAPENMLAILPDGFSMQEAVTLPNNFVTVFHTLTTDLGFALPWPKPNDWVPKSANGSDASSKTVLIWGGSSSVGQFALQIMHWYGYTKMLATASKRNHAMLKTYGAGAVFDYNNPAVIAQIDEHVGDQGVDYVLDCIGSKTGSLAPIAKIATKGTKVAVLLPVIVRDASETEAPEYTMDVEAAADWKEDVVVKGVRTHFYQNNTFFKEQLQPVIMPQLLERGIVKPNQQRIVEGKTLLERAQKALDMLRRKEVSGERLVWRVAEG